MPIVYTFAREFDSGYSQQPFSKLDLVAIWILSNIPDSTMFVVCVCLFFLNTESLLKTAITNNSTSFLNYMYHSGSLWGISVI